MSEKQFSPEPPESKQEKQSPKGVGKLDITKSAPYQRLKGLVRHVDNGLTQLENTATQDVKNRLQKEGEEFDKELDPTNHQ